MTLDVEHFARVKLVREVTEREGEDGYSIVSDYLAALNHDDRRRRLGEIKGFLRDTYSGDLARKYTLPDSMPLWVYLEMASFGSFSSLYLFLRQPLERRAMREEHYQLRQSQLVRNACAHSSDVINGFSHARGPIEANVLVLKALADAGISHRVRTSKMRNPRLQQIATMLYLHSQIVPEGTSRERACDRIAQLKNEMLHALETLSGTTPPVRPSHFSWRCLTNGSDSP